MGKETRTGTAPSKARRIVYWASTGLFAAGMTAGGVVDIIQPEDAVKTVTRLGYPLYFLTLLGVAKLLGSAALLAPRFPRLKEWAYAGFTINLVSAGVSHLAAGDSPAKLLVPAAFAALGIASYFARPAGRKL